LPDNRSRPNRSTDIKYRPGVPQKRPSPSDEGANITDSEEVATPPSKRTRSGRLIKVPQRYR
jgi:hypothetical protein